MAFDTPGESPQALVSESCPANYWQEALAAQSFVQPAPGERHVFVNVGANKGYAIAEFLQVWTRTNLTNRHWLKTILSYAHVKEKGMLKTQRYLRCGVCKACERLPFRPHTRDVAVEAHALELIAENRELISWVANATGVGGLVHVHALAGSNVTEQLTYKHSEMTTAGREGTSLCLTSNCTADGTVQEKQWWRKITRSRPEKHYVASVQAITLDEFLQRQRLRRVFHVQIDAEGWDPLVVEGMRRSLEHRAVGAL